MENLKKLNDLAKSLYDHKLAASMDEAVAMAEKMLTNTQGEAMSAGGGITSDAASTAPEKSASAGETASAEKIKQESRPIKVEVKEEVVPDSGLTQEDIQEEQEIEKEIAAIESPEEEAKDQAALQDVQSVKEALASSDALDAETTAGVQNVQTQLGESKAEAEALDEDLKAFEEIPKDAIAVQKKEWEASKVDEYAKKKLPNKGEDPNKVYDEEAKEEE